jgi:hypothetical protein
MGGCRPASMTENETSPPYPNSLRKFREKAFITRAQLIERCKKLSEEDSTRFVKLGMSALRDLELCLSRPRMNTAATLAAALATTPGELFPAFDDPIRNPAGNTRIPKKT